MRLDPYGFAGRVGVDPRSVTDWERRAEEAHLQSRSKQLLDTALNEANSDEVARFEMLTGRADPKDSASGSTVPVIGIHSMLDAELRVWIDMNRRELMRLLGAVGSLPASALLLGLGGDGLERVAHAARTKVDTKAVTRIEGAVDTAFWQYEEFGPGVAIHTMRAQSSIVDALLPDCPSNLEGRLLTLRGALSRGLGQIAQDADNTLLAAHYYEQARQAAHHAHDMDLAILVLCTMSSHSRTQGHPRIGVDHAVAAQNWAKQSSDNYLAAYAADMAAEAFADLGSETECRAALDRSRAFTESTGGTDTLAYFYGAGLNAGDLAVAAAGQALDLIEPEFVLIRGFAMINLGNARCETGEIDGAAGMIGQSADLASRYDSPPLAAEIRSARARINRAAPGSRALRKLDDKLAAYALT